MRLFGWTGLALAGLLLLGGPAAAQEDPKGKSKGVERRAKSGMDALDEQAEELGRDRETLDKEAEAEADRRAAEAKAKAQKKAAEARKKAKGKPAEAKAKGQAKAAEAKAKGQDEVAEAKGKGQAEAAEAKAEGQAKAAEAKGRGKKGGAAAQRAEAKAHLAQAGVKALSPAVLQQQRRHAKRMAQLARIREVAQAEGDDRAVERVEALVDKEQRRHQAWLDKKEVQP